MSDAVTVLQTEINARIAEIDDTIGRAEAAVVAERYIHALQSQEELEAGSVASYTVAGRTITRRDPSAGHGLVRLLRSELMAYIGGNIVASMGGTP